jgi:hypothetical protein
MSFARVVAFLGCLLLLAGHVSAATVLVAPNGVDSGSCGRKGDPCLTITRAIANAGIDDTVLVAPGRYGDVNGNLAISGPGEETPNVNGCGCVLEIGKRVTVVSRDGAAATIIDGGKADLHTVRLSADGAVFGKKNKGFTITGGGSGDAGLDIVANGTTVTGHVFVDNPTQGMRVEGARNLITGNRFFSKGADGVLVTGNANAIAESAATGTSNVSGIGFSITGSGNTLRAIFASGNAVGVSFVGGGHVMTGSVVVRNTIAGIDLAGTGSNATITKTTIHGNGGTLLVNCGIVLSSDDTSAVATANYWGAPTGPGSDPADDVCVFSNGTAVTTPFATKEHKTPTKPLR